MRLAVETSAQTTPSVAIVVPSFQQGRYLPFALEGLTRQTYSPVETSVFDNVSTDASGDVLRLFEGRVSRIVRAADGGQADALRTGFGDSDGEVLGWLNADDMILPDAIERVTSIFRSRPDVDVVYGECAFLSERGQFLGYFHDVQDFSRRDLLNFSDFIPQPSTFFRRSAYEAAGGIDETLEYTMDWDLWCRMARVGCKFLRVREVLAAARVHPEAKTSSGGLRRARELWKVNRRHARLGIPFMAAAHLYQKYLRRYVGPLAALPRWAWSTVLAAPRSNTFVQGIGPGGRLTGGPFRVRFPVFSQARRLRLWSDQVGRLAMDTPRGAFAGASFSRSPDQVVWEMQDPTFAAEIDISGVLAHGTEAWIRVEWD